ncbi:MAG: hypothetical protein ACUVTB_06815 [Candidatus Bathycorpusculaceae bacterium]
MVKFTLKMDRNNKVYIPKPIREAGFIETLEIIPNAFAAVVYPSGADLERVKKSLEVILKDVEHRLKGR